MNSNSTTLAADITFVSIDTALVGFSLLQGVVALLLALLMICMKNDQYNALYFSRFLVALFVAVWDLGIMLGFDSFWKLVFSYTPNDNDSVTTHVIAWFCRINNVFVLGLGHSACTSLIVFMNVHRVQSTLLSSKNGPALETTRLLQQRQQHNSSNRESTSSNQEQQQQQQNNNSPNWWDMSFRVNTLSANAQVFWKAFVVTLLVFLLQVAVVILDTALRGLDFLKRDSFAFLSELYSPVKVQCMYPIIPAAIAAVNFFVFLLVYNIFGARLLRRLENIHLRQKLIRIHVTITIFTSIDILLRGAFLIANIFQWPFVDRIFKILVYSNELLLATMILIFYIFLPIYSNVKIVLWRANKGLEIQKFFDKSAKFNRYRSGSDAPMLTTIDSSVNVITTPMNTKKQLSNENFKNPKR